MDFVISRAGYDFHFRTYGVSGNTLQMGYMIPGKIWNKVVGDDGYYPAEYRYGSGIIRFLVIKKLDGRKAGGININDRALEKQLTDIIDKENEKKKLAVKASILDIKNNRTPIELEFKDGEYLSGYTVYGPAAELLKDLGLAEEVRMWGYLVDLKFVNTVGRKFYYKDAVKYAKPALDAKAAKEKQAELKRLAREREKSEMDVRVIRKVLGKGQADSYAEVEVTDVKTGESGKFVCRNIFDFGYVINPFKGEGIPVKRGSDWYWRGKTDKKMTDFEVKAVSYLFKFPPISKGLRM